MNQKTIILLACLLYGFQLLAQEEKTFSPFQISFVYPLGTNGGKANEYTNGVSINLLVGLSKNENNFALAGISNVILQNAKGVYLAGISNHIGKTGKGLSAAGVTNITSKYYNGVQFSGIWNNSGSESKGVMISGVGNMVNGNFCGLQVSGLINIANDIRGAQIAGLINTAKKVKGVQFAMLANIAEESDYPIGLINIIKNGEKGIAFTYDILGNSIVSFRSGGKYAYGILGIGFNHKTRDNDKMVTEAGYGMHIPIYKWFQINNEIKATTIGSISEDSSINLGYLLAPSFMIREHYNLFGGISFNYFTSKSMNADTMLPNNSLWNQKQNNRMQQIYIGYQAGIQYTF